MEALNHNGSLVTFLTWLSTMKSSLGNLVPSKNHPKQTVKKKALNFSILEKE